jgi:hypothetical protein
MKTFALYAMALVLLAAPAAFAAEQLREVDASGGTSNGQWVLFISKGAAPNAPMGTAAVAVGKGDKFQAGYGLHMAAGKPTVAAVKEELIKSERESDKEPAATTLIVKVSKDQHAEVTKIIKEWTKIEEHIDPPNDVAVNFVQEIIDALGMKRAYRTGLAPVNPVQYYADLSIVNRKLGQDKS